MLARQLLIGLLSVALLSLALFGCAPIVEPTGGFTQPTSAAASSTQAVLPSATPQAKPVRDDLVIGVSKEKASTLDPRLDTANLYPLLFNALTRLDASGRVKPDAASWTIQDNKIYTFVIKKGITFSDGQELTAEDVKYSYDTMRDPKFGSPNQTNLAGVESIEVLDKYTVKFTLKQPFAPFLAYVSSWYSGIVPKQIVEKDLKGFGARPIGSGPYVLEKWTPAEELVLRARADYWEGVPKIKKVTFRAQADETVRQLKLETGEIDVNLDVPLSEVKRLRTEGKFKVEPESLASYEYVGFNTKAPPFNDKRVRQALAYGTDVKQIVSSVFYGLTQPVYGPLPPGSWAYNPAVEGVYPYNPEKAKQLLAEAGYKDGLNFKLEYIGRWEEPKYTQVLQSQWKQIGVNVQLVQKEYGAVIDDLMKGNYEHAFVMAWVGIWDPDQVMYRGFVTGGGLNFAKYSNPQVDQFINLGRSSTDTEARKKAYHEAQMLIMEDAPLLFLEVFPRHLAYNPKLQNFAMSVSGWGTLDAMLSAEWSR